MKKAKSGIKGLIIFLICGIEVYLLFWLVTASLKKQSEWSEYPAYALNKGFHVQNYIDAWTRGNMATYFKNSLITTVVSLKEGHKVYEGSEMTGYHNYRYFCDIFKKYVGQTPNSYKMQV
ncbi:hypothetical protein [Muricomes intestini]|jgi:AraC-like DNA-binding protein|uniref:hypothetical protein n=1 Tax=Muricomes intestini TaxID=1796634 RepID=UPI00269820AA